MMKVIRALLFLAGAVLALPVAYLLLLTGAATVQTLRERNNDSSDSTDSPDSRRKDQAHQSNQLNPRAITALSPPRTRFLVLIPAHNEEALLPATLDSLALLDYPRELYAVHVVADNCDDRTAEIARLKGAGATRIEVHERHDPQLRGKGHALRWLLERLWAAGEPHDAVVILDADSVVTPNFLRAMAARLERGERVIQAYYAVLATIEYDSGDVVYVSCLTKLASISDIVNLVESVSLT